MKKVYEVIFVDVWDNFIFLGFFDDLKKAVPHINGELSVYGEQYVLKEEDLKVYPSTYNECFDIQFSQYFEENEDNEDDEVFGCSVRGFIHELDDKVADYLCGLE